MKAQTSQHESRNWKPGEICRGGDITSELTVGREHERGAVATIVVVALMLLVGFAALAIDIGHLWVVRNELKNAADAGALAGAATLYTADGTAINPDCNQTARDVAIQNMSEKVPVEVDSGGANGPDVERGHWSFATSTFTANPSLAVLDLWDATPAELDANADLINACRVRTKRNATPASSYFARIFGRNSFTLEAESVAYLGFTGTIGPGEVDQPIAICKQAIIDHGGKYSCNVGRMINSGQNAGHQTGGWTNFSQGPCETASASSVRPLVCGSGNQRTINVGQGVGTTGGQEQSAFKDLHDCWKNNRALDTNGDGIPDQPWTMKLLVIDCPGNNTSNCSTVVGTVEVNVVWILDKDPAQHQEEYPRKMGDWTCASGLTGPQCWSSFVDHFKLKEIVDATASEARQKTVYFQPDCTPHAPAGTTGGSNFGVLAKRPVLVK